MIQITWDEFVERMAKVTHYLKKEGEECTLCRTHANLGVPIPCGQCLAAQKGECYVIQDCIFNPYDDRGCDVVCTTHSHKMNIKGTHGNWNIKTPTKCPIGEAKESGQLH